MKKTTTYKEVKEKTDVASKDMALKQVIQPTSPEHNVPIPKIMKSASSRGDEPLILVVEDDKASRDLLEFTLISEGYRVVSTDTGKEALELAEKMNPFAITLDIMMPGMDGWDVLKHLKEKEKTHNIQ